MKGIGRKLVIAAIVLFAVLVIGGFAMQWYLVSSRLNPVLEQQAALVKRVWPRVQEDLDKVGAHPFFERERPGDDAGSLLNPLLPWSGDPKRSSGLLQERFDALDPALRERLRSGPDMTKEIDDPQREKIQALDFGWMKEAQSRGYWSVATENPDGRVLSNPAPQYLLITRWSKLRLLRGVVDDDLAAAAQEVQHLAWLCISTETLVGAMVGVAILDVVRAVAPETAGMTAEDIERFKRLLFGTPGFTTPTVPDAARREFDSLARAKLPIARCIAWTEGSMSYLIKPYIDSRFPEFYADLDALRPGDGGCRFDIVAPVQAASARDPWSIMVSEDAGDAVLDESWSRLPLVRDAVGVILLSVATPGFLNKYEAL